MKWKNKGHELDTVAKRLKEVLYDSKQKIYIFGAGNRGRQLQKYLSKLDMFAGYIDNDVLKQKDGIEGAEVISLEKYIERGKKNVIIISPIGEIALTISEQLKKQGLILNQNFYRGEYFLSQILPILMTYFADISFVNAAQIILTQRCTLKCEKCMYGCFKAKNNNEDMSFERACQSADYFFEKVNMCHEFVLIGGETLLYQKLSKIVEYIGLHYREQIGDFIIVTNGTILPSEQLLFMCQKYQVEICVSNYSVVLPELEEKYQNLIKCLNEYAIKYTLLPPEITWVDFGFDYVDNGVDGKKLTDIFDRCQIHCREINGNKFYFCSPAKHIADNFHYNVGEDDYLDMDKLTGEDYKKILLEFNLGYSEKGYLDMCRRCHGAEAYKYPVPAGRQISKSNNEESL